MTKHFVKTCGKLYLAGEYSVLTPAQTAIIKNIPIYMEAEIEEAEAYLLQSDLFTHSVDLSPDPDYSLIQETVAVMELYLKKQGLTPHPFHLSIKGKMEREGKKFGLGSSGSVVILTLRAMASFYQLDLPADLVFRLASYVLLKRGDNGSMGDLACIAYEKLVAYTSFDRQYLSKKIKGKSLLEVLDLDWGYEISVLEPALTCDFLVGWTQQPAISKDMVKLVKSAISEEFLKNTQRQVLTLQKALKEGEKEQVMESLRVVSQLLEDLHPAIYNEALTQLKQAADGLDAVAKSSGAGGGDCGVALSFSAEASCALKQVWQDCQIELLYEERICPSSEKTTI